MSKLHNNPFRPDYDHGAPEPQKLRPGTDSEMIATPRMTAACKEGTGIAEGCKLECELAALEAELNRVNPLYTAARIRARDAEQRLAQIERETIERCAKHFEDKPHQEMWTPTIVEAIRALRTATAQEAQSIIGADPASKDGDYACQVKGRIEGSNIIIEEINYSSAAPASEYAAGLAQWADLHQGEKK